jgi:hypothetical protein
MDGAALMRRADTLLATILSIPKLPFIATRAAGTVAT